jgi:hypothetical protein
MWQPTGQALRNIPDIATAPGQAVDAAVPEQGGRAGEAPAQAGEHGAVALNYLYSIIAKGPDPQTARELQDSPFKDEWWEADCRELNSHYEHETWTLIPRQVAKEAGQRIYKCKIIRKTKLHPNGSLDKRRSRFTIAALSKTLVEGVDYEEK